MPNPVIFAPGTIQRLRTCTMRCLYFLERDPGANGLKEPQGAFIIRLRKVKPSMAFVSVPKE